MFNSHISHPNFFYKNPKLAALHIKKPQKLFTPFYYILLLLLTAKKSTTNCVRLRRVYRAFTFQYLPLKGQRLLETLFLALQLSYYYYFLKKYFCIYLEPWLLYIYTTYIRTWVLSTYSFSSDAGIQLYMLIQMRKIFI